MSSAVPAGSEDQLRRKLREAQEAGDRERELKALLDIARRAFTELLKPVPKLLPTQKGETMADVSGVLSRGVTTSIGLDFLGRFFAAFGALALIDKLGARYKASRTASLKFRFTEATRDSMDPIAFGTRLIDCKPIKDHPLVAEGNQYFVVTAVARTPSISVVAEAGNEQGGNIDRARFLAKISSDTSSFDAPESAVSKAGQT